MAITAVGSDELTRARGSLLPEDKELVPMTSRDQTIRCLLILCAVTLIPITVWAIVVANSGILDRVLTLIGHVLSGVLGWAISRAQHRPTPTSVMRSNPVSARSS